MAQKRINKHYPDQFKEEAFPRLRSSVILIQHQTDRIQLELL